jgi:hypothetical protein
MSVQTLLLDRRYKQLRRIISIQGVDHVSFTLRDSHRVAESPDIKEINLERRFRIWRCSSSCDSKPNGTRGEYFLIVKKGYWPSGYEGRRRS